MCQCGYVHISPLRPMRYGGNFLWSLETFTCLQKRILGKDAIVSQCGVGECGTCLVRRATCLRDQTQAWTQRDLGPWWCFICVYVWRHVRHRGCMSRGQRTTDESLRAWWQLSLPTEPSYQLHLENFLSCMVIHAYNTSTWG